MNILKSIHKFFMYGYKRNSNSYLTYLRKAGVTIGENVIFHEPYTNYIDTQKGFLISIGNNVQITRNVIILTHDYSWAVLKAKYNEIIGFRKKVEIGDNVFIGMNSIIMGGVKIGKNVIIGANSVVTKDIPDDSIVCGNPAKIISNIDSYYTKRKNNYIEEAEEMFYSYYRKYNRIPPKKIFDEFFWIFESRKNVIEKEFDEKMKLCGNYFETKNQFYTSKGDFDNYEQFVEFCKNKYKIK